jgi:hypothetical protein
MEAVFSCLASMLRIRWRVRRFMKLVGWRRCSGGSSAAGGPAALSNAGGAVGNRHRVWFKRRRGADLWARPV